MLHHRCDPKWWWFQPQLQICHIMLSRCESGCRRILFPWKGWVWRCSFLFENLANFSLHRQQLYSKSGPSYQFIGNTCWRIKGTKISYQGIRFLHQHLRLQLYCCRINLPSYLIRKNINYCGYTWNFKHKPRSSCQRTFRHNNSRK